MESGDRRRGLAWSGAGAQGAATFLSPTPNAASSHLSSETVGATHAPPGNNRVRRVDGVTGIITTYAGGGASLGDGGPATQGQLLAPNDLVVDVQRNVYIADTGNYRIRKVDGLTGVITTLAGNGIAGFTGDGGAATAARIGTAKGLAIDYAANVYFSDVVNASNHRVRLVSAPGGLISTFAGAGPQGSAGDGGTAASANLNTPFGIVLDPGGRVQVTDKSNHRIRAVK